MATRQQHETIKRVRDELRACGYQAARKQRNTNTYMEGYTVWIDEGPLGAVVVSHATNDDLMRLGMLHAYATILVAARMRVQIKQDSDYRPYLLVWA